MKYTLRNLTPEESLTQLRHLWLKYPECRKIIELQAKCLKSAIAARSNEIPQNNDAVQVLR